MTPDWMLTVSEYAERFYTRKADQYLYAMKTFRGDKHSRRYQKLKNAESLCREWADKASNYDLGPLGEELIVDHREMISMAIQNKKPVPQRVKDDLWRR